MSYRTHTYEFGERVRRAREDRGMSLRELSRRCEVSAAYISDIERGNRFGEGVISCLVRELAIGENAIDLHYYRHGRIGPGLQFGDYGHVEACLERFRAEMES